MLSGEWAPLNSIGLLHEHAYDRTLILPSVNPPI